MRWIVGSSVRLRHLVIVMAVVVTALGITQVRSMPVDLLPDFAPAYVEVQTEALGLSAPEIEQLVTVPLEADLLNGVGGVDVIRSNSVPGLSSIVLVFEPGTEILEARQLVQERLTQAHALPNVSKPPEMIQPLSSTSRIAMISLSSEQLSLVDQSVLARWVIRPRLMGVPGVANIAIWGQRERQLQVQVDPARLQSKGVSLSQVVQTAGNAQLVSPLTFLEASTPGTGGFIDTPNQRLGIRHVLPLGTPAELAKVPVEDAAGGLRLGDVATVVENHQPLIGDAVVKGKPGLLLVVEQFPEADVDAVTRGVESALDSMQPGLTGLELDSTAFRPASYIESAIDNLSVTLLIAALLVALVLALLFFDWRAAVISAVSIVLSLGATSLVLALRGGTLNMMVVAGFILAIGAIVADAIADVDGIVRQLRDRPAGDTTTAIVEASLDVRRPLIYATVIGVLVVFPVFFLDGSGMAFLEELLLAYTLAVVAAMLVALTVTPALCALLLSRTGATHRQTPARRLADGAASLLPGIIRRPRRVYIAAALTAVAGLAMLPLLNGASLVPGLQERTLVVRWDGAPGTSHPEMSRITMQAAGELGAIRGVKTVNAHVGRAISADQVVGINSGEVWIVIDPGADYDATRAEVQRVVDGYPGLSTDVETYHAAQVEDAKAFEPARLYGDDGSSGSLAKPDSAALAGADDVVVRVFGQELAELRRQAERVRQILAGIDGVTPRIESLVEEPNVEVKVDIAAAQAHQIKPGDVRRAAAKLLQGIQVGSLFEEQKVFEVVVLGTPETRNSLTSIRGLLIDTPAGGQVRLGDIADVQIVPTPAAIKREAVSRRIDVGATVGSRSVDSVLREIDQRLADTPFPLEYHAELVAPPNDVIGGLSPRELSYLVAAAIGILLLLQSAFGSWRLAAVLLVTLPLALVGGLLVAVGIDRELSLGALAGLFAVFGLAVRNSVLLVGRYQLSEPDGGRLGPELAVRGVSDRLAPILVGAAATVLALVPLAVVGEIAGQEIARPMALVIAGGLVTSTAFSLVLVPLLCLRFWPARTGSVDAQPEIG
ncbi:MULTISPECIES: efflux RND transporter permease subunit [Kribbella]|uniref:efflux RND transporter permease subunit n=1 Tax=Kribbella TaxID=182639 RepID=UPI00104DDF29|nr:MULTISPECIES: efflux RND transporter permease subunit [Kribbella]